MGHAFSSQASPEQAPALSLRWQQADFVRALSKPSSFLWVWLPGLRICGHYTLQVQCPQLALNQREALTRSCPLSSGTAFKLRVLPLVLV